MVEKLSALGVKLSETGYCSSNSRSKHLTVSINRCANEGECVEFYDKFKCNCSKTSFAGERCEQGITFCSFCKILF